MSTKQLIGVQSLLYCCYQRSRQIRELRAHGRAFYGGPLLSKAPFQPLPRMECRPERCSRNFTSSQNTITPTRNHKFFDIDQVISNPTRTYTWTIALTHPTYDRRAGFVLGEIKNSGRSTFVTCSLSNFVQTPQLLHTSSLNEAKFRRSEFYISVQGVGRWILLFLGLLGGYLRIAASFVQASYTLGTLSYAPPRFRLNELHPHARAVSFTGDSFWFTIAFQVPVLSKNSQSGCCNWIMTVY
ncbi:hypothetical protein ABKN59_007296 [Abortiporus biennis]